MNLLQAYEELKFQGSVTDKGTDHDYIEGYYNNCFTSIQHDHFSLLEIGVQEGYSMDLWRKWFTNACLFAIDLTWNSTIDRINNTFKNATGFLGDGFTSDTLSLFEDNSLDYIIEDGPHTLTTQIFAAQRWTNKLKSGGMLIIEDIQIPDQHCQLIIESIANRSDLSAQIFDLRPNKQRYDDVIVQITKK